MISHIRKVPQENVNMIKDQFIFILVDRPVIMVSIFYMYSMFKKARTSGAGSLFALEQTRERGKTFTFSLNSIKREIKYNFISFIFIYRYRTQIVRFFFSCLKSICID